MVGRGNLRKGLLIAIMCTVTVLSSIAICVVSYAAPSNEKLVVGVPSDRCPVFYVDNQTNEIVGIGIDLINAVAEEAGYDVEIKNISEENLKQALDNPEYDIVMPFGSAITSANGKASIVSENISETPFTLVTTRRGSLHQINSLNVGMVKSLSGVAETVSSIYPDMKITFYDDMRESVKALRCGDVEALLNNSYVWSYILQKPAYSDLYVQPSAMLFMNFKVGTLDTPKGHEIIARINKGIAQLDDAEVQAIVLDYTTRRLYRYDFFDYVKLYGILFLLGILLFIALIGIFIYRQRSLRLMQEEKLHRMIDHDELTGVYSLNGFRKRVEEILREYPNVPYFISYNNIVDFKFINDSFGKDTGDKLLKYWAKVSREVLSENEAIGRITADRFAILRIIPEDNKIFEDEKNVIEPVNNYLISLGKNYKVQICSGIYVLTPEDFQNIDVDHFLDYARMAEKKIHESGKNSYEFYNLNQWESKKRSVDIVSHLSPAIQNGEIQVWYQPQVNYETKEIIGAEALCRWTHTNLGWISPSEFIPALETSGKIYELDCFVWEKVCQDLHNWNQHGKTLTISVNVSRTDIEENPDIHEHFKNLIYKYELSPEQLHIEITESAYVKDSELLIKTTDNLRSAGFHVEMDDFGSGYSSLNMMKEMQIDRIKLDMRFLSDDGPREKGQIIVNYMIQMIQALELELIAEGVETLEQAEFLYSKGLKEMQGYYFYKPMNVLHFEELL